MYTLSSKLKLTAIIFIVVGAIGMIYGFLAAPSSIEEVEKIIAEQETQNIYCINYKTSLGRQLMSLHSFSL